MQITKEQADNVIAALEIAKENARVTDWPEGVEMHDEALTIMRGLNKKSINRKKKIVPITHVVPYPYADEPAGHSELYAYKTRNRNYK